MADGSQGHAKAPGDRALAARLSRALKGEVLFDTFSRGRYSTDASIYQIEPLGVVVPRDKEDVAAALAIAREEGVPVLPRGAGTSQCGQTVGRALVIDCSKRMDKVLSVDVEGRRDLPEKMGGERGDLRSALAKRRDRDGERADPIVKRGVDASGQLARGRAEDADASRLQDGSDARLEERRESVEDREMKGSALRDLEERGLPLVSQAGRNLFRRQEAQDFVALIRTLADPSDTLALGALLRGPLVGLTNHELLDITRALAPNETKDGAPAPILTLQTPPDQINNPLARETLIVLADLRRRVRRTTPFLLLSEAIDPPPP